MLRHVTASDLRLLLLLDVLLVCVSLSLGLGLSLSLYDLRLGSFGHAHVGRWDATRDRHSDGPCTSRSLWGKLGV
jgi:hypothetical protein